MQSNFCVPGIADPNLKDIIVSSYFLSWTKLVLSHAKKAGNRFGFLIFVVVQEKIKMDQRLLRNGF
jgi:hypothetical protein